MEDVMRIPNVKFPITDQKANWLYRLAHIKETSAMKIKNTQLLYTPFLLANRVEINGPMIRPMAKIIEVLSDKNHFSAAFAMAHVTETERNIIKKKTHIFVLFFLYFLGSFSTYKSGGRLGLFLKILLIIDKVWNDNMAYKKPPRPILRKAMPIIERGVPFQNSKRRRPYNDNSASRVKVSLCFMKLKQEVTKEIPTIVEKRMMTKCQKLPSK